MDISVIEKSLESLIDWVIGSDISEIKEYVNEISSNNSGCNNRQIAEVIVSEQSINSGLLGAITGAGGLITLPVTIPVDMVKAWKIQAFTIRCIAEVYGYSSQTTDLKTDIFLVLSNGSIESIKSFVMAEALKSAPKQALKSLHSIKTSVIQKTTKQAPKYIAKTALQLGGKPLRNYALKGVPSILRGAIWKLGGRKVAEKTLQKSIGKAIPVIGAVVGGGMDWFATQAVGRLAIEYYENSVPELVNEVFGLCE
jgi:hypothetical protein